MTGSPSTRAKRKGKKGKGRANTPAAVVGTALTWRPDLFVSLRGPHSPRLHSFVEEHDGDVVRSLSARSFGSPPTTAREVLDRLSADNTRKYAEKMGAYRDQQRKHVDGITAQKAAVVAARRAWTDEVSRDAEDRRLKERAAQRERERVAAERLKQVAAVQAEEDRIELEDRNQRLAEQARDMETRMRKKSEEEARQKEIQEAIARKRAKERAEMAREEAAEKQRAEEWLAETRRAKQEAWAWKANQEAQQKAREDAEVKRRFKQSEKERLEREAQQRADERREARQKEAAFRKKMDEEKRLEREELRERERANKAAAKEALAMLFQEDEHGRLVRIEDPSAEMLRKMRKLEEENARAMAERDAAIAAKEAAFERAKKRDERRRALQVEAAQRKVAAIFRANQDKELADRLAREAAEKARFRQIAIETREKIEEDNRRQREAERLAELHLKEAKEAEYEAVRAAHSRRDLMEQLKAQNERRLQVESWQQIVAWEGESVAADRSAQVSSKMLFQRQLRMREQHAAENRGGLVSPQLSRRAEAGGAQRPQGSAPAAEVEA